MIEHKDLGIYENINWDEFYMGLAFYVAMKSEDTSTKVGAVFVNDYNRVLSLGLNGIPSGVSPEEDMFERPDKYLYFEHAERNAVYNAQLPLVNSRVYVNMFPCAECARAIIQVRSKEIIYHEEFNAFQKDGHEWDKSHKAALRMFDKRGLKVTPYSGAIPSHIYGWKAGHKFDLTK